MIGIQAIPLLHKRIEKFLGQDHVPLLNNLKAESQFHILRADGPAHIIPINLRKSRVSIRYAEFRVISHAGVVLSNRVLKIHAPQTIREVHPELHDSSFRINIIVWQFRAVNLRNHTQRITMSIGGRIHTFREVGHSPKLRRSHWQWLWRDSGGDTNYLTLITLIQQ